MKLNDGTDWQPSQEQIESWVEAYPAVSVERELAAMSAWVEANPKKAKTKRGAPRFCVNWLSRAQDRGGSSPMAKSSGLIVKTRDMTSLDELSHNFMGDPEMRDHFIEKFGQCFENGVRYT